MTEYPYSFLSPDENMIRILRIARGKRSDPITCKLFDTYPSQDKGLGYKALSYTWGGSVQTHRIYVDGYEFGVTENLFSALCEIRCQDQDVMLWVDSVCINQGNQKEKGHQVKQMGDVYKGAEEVIVWLGPSDDDIASLIESINWIDGRALGAEALGSKADWTSLCSWYKKERFWSPTVEAHVRERLALQELLERQWFNRVWVLQEVANARTARIMCGSKSCPARTFALMPSLMGLEVNEHVQAVLDIMPRIRRDSWWSSQRNLHFLIGKFAKSQATETRDKVYALLGMSEDANNPKRFYPCYEKDMPKVFRDTVCFLLFGEILDRSYSFPQFGLGDLSHPILELAERTLEWALDQTGMSRGSAHRTATLLVDRLNEGQLKKGPLLRSLAKAHGQNNEMLSILSHGDVRISTALEDDWAILQITSKAGTGLPVTLTYPRGYLEERMEERMKERMEQRMEQRMVEKPVPALFGENRDVRKTISRMIEIGSSKEELLREYTWAGDRDGVKRQLEGGANVDGVDANRSTALHLAARWRFIKIPDILDILNLCRDLER